MPQSSQEARELPLATPLEESVWQAWVLRGRVYGPAARPPAPVKAAEDRYREQEESIARWQDSQYCYDLVQSSYGPSFKLVGVLKRLDAPAQTAELEARRLDDREAPQRDAARLASEQGAASARLEQARLVNKARFRP